MKNIVFEGSGINGMAYLGVIRELENQDIMKNMTHYGGASSGAFFSTMLALGYNSHELETFLKELDIGEITSTNKLCQIYNLIRYWGLHKKNVLRSKMEYLFEKKFNKHLTFSELFNKTGKILVIVVSNIILKESQYIHYYNNPDRPIIEVLISSISIPGLFTLDTQNYLIDGGITDNYPLWIFNDLQLLKNEDYTTLRNLPISPETIGVKFMENRINKVNNIFEYILSIINSMLLQLEHVVKSEHYYKQTIQLEKKMDTFNFDIDDDQIQMLIEYGMSETKKYIYNYK